jgi:hypothetical protein
MRTLALLLTLFLLGCDTVPVERNFPQVPAELLKECPALAQTPPGSKFSEVLTIVNDNYAEYHQCRAKTQSWIKWYTEQKKIFDEVK